MRLPARRPNALAILLGGAVLIIIGLATALIMVTTGQGSGDGKAKPTSAAAQKPAAVTVTGEIRMKRYDDNSTPGVDSANWTKTGDLNCEGSGGYDDMTEGATVTVYSSAGSVVGVGALQEGLAGDDQCVWTFEVPGVPEAPFYQVEVSHRGKVAVPRSEATAVSLTLG